MKRSTSRLTLALSATCTAALALTACSSSGGSGGIDGPIEGTVGYSFWGTPARAEKVATVIEQFEEANPGATIDPEVADYFAYVERLTVRAAGGDLACVTGSQSTFLSQYAENETLRPLDDLIASGQIDTAGIPEDVLTAGQIDGKQFMIPTGTFVRVMGYNEQLVTDAGAPAPTDDMTWEQWAQWLRELQPKLPDGVYAAENEGGNMFTLTSWVIGHGGTMFDEDGLAFSEDDLKEFFEYWIALQNEGVALPASSIPEQNGALELTPIAQRKAASGTRDIPHLYVMEQALSGSGQATKVPEVSMPSEDPSESANVLGSNGLSISSECDNIPTAAAYINHFANDTDAALAFQSDNGILTNTAAQDALLADPQIPEGVKQNVTILRTLTDSGDVTTSTYPTGLGTVTTELLRQYEAAAFGNTSVDDAVTAFFAAANDALG